MRPARRGTHGGGPLDKQKIEKAQVILVGYSGNFISFFRVTLVTPSFFLKEAALLVCCFLTSRQEGREFKEVVPTRWILHYLY
jgi:hypothetical protein